ncbi:DNA mismatch repair protein MutT [Rathayibacter sp. AY2B7]|uniref:NUDIX domain-containing protein n=1 Tax=unclassified Rathayibacter TaxID=2609250 RepID=UPI000CE898B3|nr:MULTISPECIES: NUDIX domain-containing protein [unclassified Rathayibacter]PPG03780.1 DNA mismatch repair protein MutT [Rathayibacter sp. AY2B1]PPG58105.1 DNA mismatch repair protein MutT [Rathayibacter sp. AY2B7]PPG71499.1 DNA mismatch repair protein MutT [Rathayibacter sp. AY1F4]
MAAVTSAGILLHREGPSGTEVFLGRMGGPFWTRRPRAWTIPKGVHTGGETPLDAARREFEEETGAPPPDGELTLLGAFRQSAAKTVTVFAGRGLADTAFVASNTFELEWPRGSGVLRSFPELEDARWHPLDEARSLVVAGQVAALDALAELLADPDGGDRAGTAP